MDAEQARALRALLTQAPVAALATLHQGEPALSMVPYALLPGASHLVIHVSALANHTRDMREHPEVALLVTASPATADSALALPRASLRGRALPCPADAPEHEPARAAYLAKLPQAEALFAFADFSLFLIEPRALRYVAGFGQAMSLNASQWHALWREA